MFFFSELTSTQVKAKEIIDEGFDQKNSLVFTEKQTMGQTRKNGISWKEGNGNFYCTYILKIPSNMPNFIAQFSCALSTIYELKKLVNLDFQIKWPNDIMLNDKKLSGSLPESYKGYFLFGIGINTKSNPNISCKINQSASISIYEVEKNKIIDNKKLAISLLDNFINSITSLEYKGDYDTLIKEYKKNTWKLNQEIYLTVVNKRVILKDITSDGCLVYEDQGKTAVITTSEIFL